MSSSTQRRMASFKSDVTMVKGQVVKLGSDAQHVTLVAASTDSAIGIVQGDVLFAGDPAEVALTGGGAFAKAHGAIAAGDIVGANADATVQTAPASGDRQIGIAMESAVAGDIFSVDVSLCEVP